MKTKPAKPRIVFQVSTKEYAELGHRASNLWMRSPSALVSLWTRQNLSKKAKQ